MSLRVHAVETDTSAPINDPDRGHPVSLCGVTLISQFDWMYGVSAAVSKGELSLDDYLSLRRKVRIYETGTRPWYTIEEYATGEDGCEDIDCVKCRKLMDAALKRYWRD